MLVLEYHEDGCPGPDPAQAAEEALHAAGLDVVHGGRKPQFGAGIVWGLPGPDTSPGEEAEPVTQDA